MTHHATKNWTSGIRFSKRLFNPDAILHQRKCGPSHVHHGCEVATHSLRFDSLISAYNIVKDTFCIGWLSEHLHWPKNMFSMRVALDSNSIQLDCFVARACNNK